METLNKYVNSGTATVYLGSRVIISSLFCSVCKVATRLITWQNSDEMPSPVLIGAFILPYGLVGNEVCVAFCFLSYWVGRQAQLMVMSCLFKEGLLDVEKLECEDELTGTEISCLRLKGQMIYLPEADSILFLCSPR